MGDLGDLFKDVKEASKQKRSENRNNAPILLEKEGIPFVSKNAGAHLIISAGESSNIIDFWPGTGKWIVRSSGYPGRGIFNMIKYLKG